MTEKILTVPNALTMSRILLSPVLGCLVLQESFTVACALFCVVGLTDLVSDVSCCVHSSQMTATTDRGNIPFEVNFVFLNIVKQTTD